MMDMEQVDALASGADDNGRSPTIALQGEVSAMSAVAEALDGLDEASCKRVLDWAENATSTKYDPVEQMTRMAQMLSSLGQAVKKHKAMTKQPRKSDEELWQHLANLGVPMPETGALRTDDDE